MEPQEITIPVANKQLSGSLAVPNESDGIVVFAHGSGSSRFSPRNRFVASQLNELGFATLLFDLLTEEEEKVDRVTRELRFDIDLLATRLAGVSDWVFDQAALRDLPHGYFGASTGAGAALVAAGDLKDRITAVVSRGGRPDLAGQALPEVTAATLLIVGERDTPVIGMNKNAYEKMTNVEEKEIKIVPNASHLFEEPGALEKVAELAGNWFGEHFASD